MQVKLTRQQAMDLAMDLFHQLAVDPIEDVVVTLPDVWSTEQPTQPGHYWTSAPGALLYLMELEQRCGVLVEPISCMMIDDLSVTHWFGPLPEPVSPVVTDDLDATGLPPGAIEMTEPDDADDD